MDETKKIEKNAIKFIVFISIASLPFLTATQILGVDTFLDSFENPNYYICLQDKENALGLNTRNGEYAIIQKSSHPDFNVLERDSIIYNNNAGEVACHKVEEIGHIGALTRYYTEETDINNSIIQEQIIGKVVNIVDNNIWNSISVTVWEISIDSLNIRALES